jgi:hypothetical protein
MWEVYMYGVFVCTVVVKAEAELLSKNGFDVRFIVA